MTNRPNTSQLEILSRQKLWLQVLVAIVLAVGFGVFIGPTTGILNEETSLLIANWISLPGKFFLLTIQFVVVPLIVASVIRGIAGNASSQHIGEISFQTVSYFVTTTLIAVVVGLVVASLLYPGGYIDTALVPIAVAETTGSEAVSASTRTRATDIPDLIIRLFPRDLLSTLIGGNMLQIVVVAGVIGVALTMLPYEQRRPITDLLVAIQSACMVIVGWALRLTPVAVFGLLAHIISRVGLSVLIGTGMYVLAVVVGLLILGIVYLACVRIFARRSTFQFLSACREPLLLAFSTSSSAAVLPVSLSVAEDSLHVNATVARFVIPLGTTINMAGTALYQGVATLFLAQVYGVDIGFGGIVLVVVMATGAAIGSPGTPGVGIVVLATILGSVGIPTDGIAILLGVDRLLDMCRTSINVLGDMVGCVTIDRFVDIVPTSRTDLESSSESSESG